MNYKNFLVHFIFYLWTTNVQVVILKFFVRRTFLLASLLSLKTSEGRYFYYILYLQTPLENVKSADTPISDRKIKKMKN